MDNQRNLPIELIKQYISTQSAIEKQKEGLKKLQKQSNDLSQQLIHFMKQSHLEQILTNQNVIEMKDTLKSGSITKHVLELTADELGISFPHLMEVIKKHKKNEASKDIVPVIQLKDKKDKSK
jgi:hypothetical protein